MNPASSHAGVRTLNTGEQKQPQSSPATATFTKNMQAIDNVLRERSPNHANFYPIRQNQDDNLLRRVVSVEEPSSPTPVASQSYDTHTTTKSPSLPLFGTKEAVSPILSKTLFVPPTPPQDEHGRVPNKSSETSHHPTSTRTKSRTSVLCDLMFQEQYLEATRRVRDCPEEASTWVVYPRHSLDVSPPRQNSSPRHGENNTPAVSLLFSNSNNNDESYERLPIHIASEQLAFATDSQLRFQLEQLILRLALIYPEGCSLEDDYNQRLPLHEAIWNNATPETISMLIMADPTSIYRKDTCGRNASEVNRHGCGVFVDQVKELLNMGLAFWEDARKKAADRFGNPQHSVKPQDVYHSAMKTGINSPDRTFPSICFDPTSDPHAYDSSLTIDLESDSILSESFHSIYEFRPKMTEKLPPQQQQQQQQQLQLYQQQQSKSDNSRSSCGILAEINYNQNTSHQGESKSAKKADMRADILQSMLLEMYDKNHKLTCTISELTKLNSTLLQHNRKPSKETIDTLIVRSNPSTAVSTPEEEFIRTKEQPHLKEKDKTIPTAQSGFVSMTEVNALRAQNNALLKKIERLNRRKKKQAEKIVYLKGIVACTASDDLLEDLSDTESTSTYSWIDSISGTEATPLVMKYNNEISMLDTDGDDCSSTGSSFHRRLESKSNTRISAANDVSTRSCLITGLAGYRMNCFVSRLYKKVRTSRETTAQEDPADIPDTIDEICDLAAKIYSDHVKESSWRRGGLVLQWDPEPRIESNSSIPLQESDVSRAELTTSTTKEGNIVTNVALPANQSLANPVISSQLNDSVFFSETSLSSIGGQSLHDGYRWI